MSKTIPATPFLFATCQVGAEKALKEEIARNQPDLRFAYSRPGFVTFKCSEKQSGDDLMRLAGFGLRSMFARTFGASLGKAEPSAAAVIRKATELRKLWGRPLRLHAWDRDRFAPGQEPTGAGETAWVTSLARAISEQGDAGAEKLFLDGSVAAEGDLVFDLIAIEENELWLGVHLHGPGHSPLPGARPSLELPPDAPSRAYLKLEEALTWFQVPVKAGDVAVEVGSAPGGACFALVSRGLSVVGIDPAEMDPRVAAAAAKKGGQFTHIPKSAVGVRSFELPESVQWLFLDMNVAPGSALRAASRIAELCGRDLLGAVLTLKLNRWDMAAELPEKLKALKTMGLVEVSARQLYHNRQEIAVCGFTTKGLQRLGRPVQRSPLPIPKPRGRLPRI